MNNEQNGKLDIDVLMRLEDLSNKLNNIMAERAGSALQRYPLTFALLVLFGVVAVSEGVKGILETFNFAHSPWILLCVGLLILVITGQLYKKLDK